jgi:hypothetical protein
VTLWTAKNHTIETADSSDNSNFFLLSFKIEKRTEEKLALLLIGHFVDLLLHRVTAAVNDCFFYAWN